MAVPIVVSTTVTDQHSGASTTLVFNMPASAPNNELYVAIGMKDDDPVWTAVPSHWNEIVSVTESTNERLMAWWWVGDNEPASYSLTMDNEIGVAVVLRISGVNLAAPENVTSTTTSGSSTNAQPTNITPNVAETLIITCIAVDTDDVTAVPSGMAELIIGGDGAAGDVGFGVAIEDGPAADVATSIGTWTHATDTWATGTIAIAPEILKTNEATTELASLFLGKQNTYAGPFEIG